MDNRDYTININVGFGLSPTLEACLLSQAKTFNETLALILQKQDVAIQQGATIMQSIQDFAAKVNANFAGIKTGIQALDDQITAFQNSPGTLSPEDQAALDGIVAASGILAAAANTAVPIVVPPVTGIPPNPPV